MSGRRTSMVVTVPTGGVGSSGSRGAMFGFDPHGLRLNEPPEARRGHRFERGAERLTTGCWSAAGQIGEAAAEVVACAVAQRD